MRNTIVKYPNKLRELRKSKGLKQHDIAIYLGFTGEDRISRWENGTMVPHLVNLIKLCQLLNASIEDLYPNLTTSKEGI